MPDVLGHINREIVRRGNPDWWIDTVRYHPDRRVRVPLARTSTTELLARELFVKVARDPELLTRRAVVLLSWYQQRKLMSTEEVR